MVGDQGQHDGRLLVRLEVGPVQCHNDGASRADDVGHPAGDDVVDVDLRVGEQTIDLLGRMFGVQAAGGSEALTNSADREGGAAQHAKGGVAERGDALGVQVVAQHVAKDLPDLIAGEPLLPGDHRIPRPAVARREICRGMWS
jgi:hypothetical protein